MNINFKELIKVYGSDIGKQRVKQDNAPHKPFCLYLHFLPFQRNNVAEDLLVPLVNFIKEQLSQSAKFGKLFFKGELSGKMHKRSSFTMQDTWVFPILP